MKPILKQTYCRIRRRIISLKKLDLLNMEYSEICELIKISFTYSKESFTQVPGGKPIYRACVNMDSNDNFIKEPFSSKKRISYNPHPKRYGRCNLIDKSIFYGADGFDVAVSEACINILSKENNTIFLTVGEWILTKDVRVSVICHSKRAHKRSGDLILYYQELVRLIKSKMPNSQFRIWRLKNKFFSDQFAKEVINGCEKNYFFSILCSQFLLSGEDSTNKIRGIYYPSVAYRFYGHNVAYDTKMIDNNTLILINVKHVKCTFTKKKRLPNIEILTSTNKFQDDLILW